MKKSKVVLGIIAAVLSAVMLFGCAGGGSASVGKKFEKILYAVDDYAVVLKGDEVALYKNGKEISGGYKNDKRKIVSIEPIAAYTAGDKEIDAYTDNFIATYDNGNIGLIDGEGTRKSTDGKVVKAYVDPVKDENGLVESYETVVLVTEGSSFADAEYLGDKIFMGTDSSGRTRIFTDENAVVTREENVSTDKIELVRDGSFGDKVVFTFTVFTDDGSQIDPDPIDPVSKAGQAKTTLYVSDKKIAGNIDKESVMPLGDTLVYTKTESEKTTFYTLALGSETPVALDYVPDFDEGAFIDGGKIYSRVSNGKAGEEEKFGIRELGGAVPSVWYDEVLIEPTDFDEETFEMSGVILLINGETTKILNFRQEELMSLSDEVVDLRYKEYFGGNYDLLVQTDKKIEFDLSGKKNTWNIDSELTVELDDDMFAIGSSEWAGTNKTVYTAQGKFVGEFSYDYSNGIYTVGDQKFFASQIRFGKGIGSVVKPEVTGVFGGTKTFYNEKIDITDESVREKFAAEAEIEWKAATYTYGGSNGSGEELMTVIYGTPQLGGQYKTLVFRDAEGVTGVEMFKMSNGDYLLSVEKETGSTLWNLSKNADNSYDNKLQSENSAEFIATMMSASGKIDVVTDLVGNTYIVTTDKNGYNAVYSEDGTLLLAPKYVIAGGEEGEYMLANGVAAVKSSVAGTHYGVVKLGATAKKTKLIKKMEYAMCIVLETGDFVVSKLGEPLTLCNADGKTVAKNIVGFDELHMSDKYVLANAFDGKEKDRELKYTGMVLHFSDGKSAVATLSLKGDDMYQALNYMYL